MSSDTPSDAPSSVEHRPARCDTCEFLSYQAFERFHERTYVRCKEHGDEATNDRPDLWMVRVVSGTSYYGRVTPNYELRRNSDGRRAYFETKMQSFSGVKVGDEVTIPKGYEMIEKTSRAGKKYYTVKKRRAQQRRQTQQKQETQPKRKKFCLSHISECDC